MEIIPNRRKDRVLIRSNRFDDAAELILVHTFQARPVQIPRNRTETDKDFHRWAAPRLFSVPLGAYTTKHELARALRTKIKNLQGSLQPTKTNGRASARPRADIR